MVERSLSMREVSGSIPDISINFFNLNQLIFKLLIYIFGSHRLRKLGSNLYALFNVI